jgi:hypothetical protein
MDYTGAANWKMIENEYKGKTVDQIESELNEMFTQDDNAELAQAIYHELN